MSGEQEIVPKEFLERFGPYFVENIDQKMNFYDSDETEIRLPFNRSFPVFWNILVVLTLKFFIIGIG